MLCTRLLCVFFISPFLTFCACRPWASGWLGWGIFGLCEVLALGSRLSRGTYSSECLRAYRFSLAPLSFSPAYFGFSPPPSQVMGGSRVLGRCTACSLAHSLCGSNTKYAITVYIFLTYHTYGLGGGAEPISVFYVCGSARILYLGSNTY